MRLRPDARVLLATLTAATAVTGCAPAPATPRETVTAYIEAVRQGDVPGAMRYVRSGAGVAGDVRALGATQQGLPSPVVGEPIYETTWKYGEEDLVVRTGPDGAHIASGVLGFFQQQTPEAAAKAFVYAVTADRPDVFASLAPARVGGLTSDEAAALLRSAEVEELTASGFLDDLAAALDEPAHRTGDGRAEVEAGTRVMMLVREPSGWKVDDIRSTKPKDEE